MRPTMSGWCLSVALSLVLASVVVAQTREVTTRGETISYVTYGSGPITIVLVHGWSNTRTFWEPHITALSERYRIVALDLASFGESTAHRQDWTMASFADDIAAVLDDARTERAVVVGFSMGGAAAIELASRRRDEVIGVVLVDILQDVEAEPTDGFIEGVLNDTREGWHDPSYVRSAGLTSSSSETLVRRYLSRTPETVPDPWWDSLRSLFLWIRNDLRLTLRDVSVPIAAINSDRIPTTVEAWRRYVPEFSVHTLHDVGHLGVIWERVDEFDEALIGFVEEFSRSAPQ